MENLEKVAIAKVVKARDASKASSEVDAGRYEVDFLVRVHGVVKKGEPYQKTQPNKIKWTLLMAILASKVNKETLQSVIREYTKAEEDGSFESAEKSIKAEVSTEVDNLKGRTTALVNGPVTTQLTAEVVGQASINQTDSKTG